MPPSIRIIVLAFVAFAAFVLARPSFALPNDGGCPECDLGTYAFAGDINYWYGFLGSGSGAGDLYGGGEDAACLGCSSGLCRIVEAGSNFCTEDGDAISSPSWHRCTRSGGGCYTQ